MKNTRGTSSPRQAIVTHCDPSYVRGALALIKSAREYGRERDVYVILRNPEKDAIERIKPLKSRIIPTDRRSGSFFFEKLHLFKLIGLYDQILYMDADTLVISEDVEQLFTYDRTALAAVPDSPCADYSVREELRRLGVPAEEIESASEGRIRFNAGVLLFNCRHLPKSIWLDLDRINMHFLEVNPTDQQILNYYFSFCHPELFQEIPRKFNWTSGSGAPPDSCCILHATGVPKPWQNGYRSRRRGEFREFAHATWHFWRSSGVQT